MKVNYYNKNCCKIIISQKFKLQVKLLNSLIYSGFEIKMKNALWQHEGRSMKFENKIIKKSRNVFITKSISISIILSTFSQLMQRSHRSNPFSN